MMQLHAPLAEIRSGFRRGSDLGREVHQVRQFQSDDATDDSGQNGKYSEDRERRAHEPVQGDPVSLRFILRDKSRDPDPDTEVQKSEITHQRAGDSPQTISGVAKMMDDERGEKEGDRRANEERRPIGQDVDDGSHGSMGTASPRVRPPELRGERANLEPNLDRPARSPSGLGRCGEGPPSQGSEEALRRTRPCAESRSEMLNGASGSTEEPSDAPRDRGTRESHRRIPHNS